jgi:hypothetical protein
MSLAKLTQGNLLRHQPAEMGVRKLQVIETADGDTDFAGKYFCVPEHPPAASRAEVPGDKAT